MPAGRADALGGAFDLALAKAVPAIPEGPGLSYESKYDGYRAVGVVEHGRVRIFSRNGTDFTARFPELEAVFVQRVPEGCVVDGEIVAWRGGRLDFDALQRRNGAGVALAKRLAAETPASFVAFDVLAVLGRDVRGLPLRDRRSLLEQLAEGFEPPLQLSPATTEPAVARRWWDELAPAGLEGIMAKQLGDTYRGAERIWWKSKRREAVDAVCAAVIGSRGRPSQLVLGLPDSEGRLRIVGRTAALGAMQSRQAAAFLHPPAGEHPWPEEVPSTWIDQFAKERKLVRLTLVEPVAVEVSADAARSHGTFRHTVRLIRFRDDVDPGSIRPS